MSLDEFNFISYDKITNQSDAFITSDELNCYVQYVPSSKALSHKIKKEAHTAGTTNDVNDYKIPDISRQLNPKKLYRINPFHKNSSEFLELNKITTDEEIVFPTFLTDYKEKKKDYSNSGLNDDQIEFLEALEALKRNEFNTRDVRLNIDEFCPVEKRMHDGYFEINARFSEVSTSSIRQAQFSQEPLETFSSGEDTALTEQLKKFGYSNEQVALKKKFKVRTGNAKDNAEVNNYLQNKIENKEEKINIFKVSNTNLVSSDFSSSINLNNQNTNIQIKKLSTTNERILKNSLNISNISTSSSSNVNIDFINNIKVSSQEKEDFSQAYKNMLKNLNFSKGSSDIYVNHINNLSKNYDYNNNNVLNLTEKKYNNLNISSFSTYNKFYTEFQNKYSNLLTEINIQNNNLESLTQFVYNNRNNITNIKRFNNTYRTSEFKSTINVFKTEKKIINEEDYFFKQAVLKTFTLSNQITKIKIEQVKDQINNVKNKISFIKHDVFKIKNYNKEYRLNEFKKIINNTEVNQDVSNILINKLGNKTDVNVIRNLVNILSENKTLSKITNFENTNQLTKFSTLNIKQIDKIVENIQTVLSQPNKLETVNHILNNSNLLNNVNIFAKSKNIQNLEKINLTSNTINNINKFSKSNLVYQSNKVSNFTDEVTLQNISSLNVNSLNNLSKIEQSLTQISQIKNIQKINDVIKSVNIYSGKEAIVRTSKNVDERKFVELHNWTNINNLVKNPAIINKITKNSNTISQDNIEQINIISKNMNALTKISKVTNLNKINQQTFQNINNIIENQDILSKSEIKLSQKNINNILEISKISQSNNSNIIKISKVDQKTLNNIVSLVDNKNVVNNFSTKVTSISEKIKIKESLESLNLNTKTINATYNTIQKISKNTQNVLKSEFLQNINIVDLHKTTKSFSTMNFDYSKKNITSLYNDLNVTNVSKVERRQDKLYNILSKNINITNKSTENNIKQINLSNKISNKLFRQEINEKMNRLVNIQNSFDAITFNKIESVNKTKDRKKAKDLLDVYNVLNASNRYSNQYNISNQVVKNVETRIVNKLSKISYDIKKNEVVDDIKILNVKKFETNNYFEEQEQKRKQEHMVSEQVEKLLVDKIQNVTNNFVQEVVTKQEINQIKNEIILEIFNIENKTEQKLSEFKNETRQTVQNMLEKFLRS
jgi:hypothetical protein